MLRGRPHLPFYVAGCLLPILTLLSVSSVGQVADPSQSETVRQAVTDLQQQIRELQSAVAEIKAEAAQYREETHELRTELEATRSELRQYRSTDSSVAVADLSKDVPADSESSSAAATQQSKSSDRLAKLEDEYQLLTGKIDDQYQTKIESASKYRVRLSGILLFNLFGNHGNVDNIDFPSLALPPPSGFSGGSFGGTVRQSQLGLEVFGPHLAGARTTGDLQFDFAGGFPNTLYGVNMRRICGSPAATRPRGKIERTSSELPHT